MEGAAEGAQQNGAAGVGGYNFTSEIRQMMFGFGDAPEPRVDSAQLVERVMARVLSALLVSAQEVVCRRASSTIGLGDILFLIRNDNVLIQRLIHAMEVRAMRSHVMKGWSCDGLVTEPEDSSKTSLFDQIRECMETLMGEGWEMDFLGLPDPDLQLRKVRAENRSRVLDEATYFKYSSAKRISFFTSKFAQWVKNMECIQESTDPSFTLTSSAVGVLSWLAQQSVAQVVEASLLVRSDVHMCSNQDRGLMISAGHVTCKCVMKPITTPEIHEAMRRMTIKPGPCLPLGKLLHQPPASTRFAIF